MTALDLGCGRGELLYALKKRCVHAVGGDYARAALELAAKEDLGPVLRCDAKRLPFKDDCFDRIFLMSLLDHLRPWELEQCLSELKRVLKPGGYVLADTCANKLYYKNWTYGARKTLARALGLREPAPPRSSQDALLHVNEHDKGDLERFFSRIGWGGKVEYRPNEKTHLEELYGKYGAEATKAPIGQELDATELRLRARVGEMMRRGS
jgi:ubiquinone/menaquinone biosynthesis C-methylase UbiE